MSALSEIICKDISKLSGIERVIGYYLMADRFNKVIQKHANAAAEELHALQERVKELEAFLHILDEDRFCDNDGRGCGTSSRINYFFHPEEHDWAGCNCGAKSAPFVQFPAICSVCGEVI